jgi:hypothetical protein
MDRTNETGLGLQPAQALFVIQRSDVYCWLGEINGKGWLPLISRHT